MENHEKSKINYFTAIIITLVMVLLFGGVSAGYLYLNQINLQEKAQEDIKKLNIDLTNEYDGIITSYYNELNDEINNISDVIDDGTLLSNLYNKYASKESNKFVMFAHYNSINNVKLYDVNGYTTVAFDEGTYDNGRYDVNVSFVNIRNLFDYEENQNAIVYRYKLNDDSYLLAFQSLDSLLESFDKVYANANNKEVYIVNNDGYFYYSSGGVAYNLYTLIGEDSTTFLNTTLSENVNSGFYKINDTKTFISCSTMLESVNDNKMMLLVCVDDKSIKDYFVSIKNQSYVYVVLSIVILAIGFIILAITGRREVVRFNLLKVNMVFSRVFCIIMKYNGTIIVKNNFFKKNFDVHNEIKSINDFNILDVEPEKKKEFVRSANSFTARFVDTYGNVKLVRFIVVGKKANYQLIGDFIDEKTISNKKLISLAYQDPITKLENQNVLEDYLSSLIEKNDENISNLSLIVWDICDFKNINDTFGNDFGNEVIAFYAKQFKKYLNEEDKIYSLGGDKIAILTTQEKEYGMMYDRCKDMYDELIKPVTISYNELVLDVACGVFDIKMKEYVDLDVKKIIKNALLANQKSHASDSRKIYIYDKSLLQVIERDAIIMKDLKNAIHNNEFIVFYQPQYDLDKNKVVGFEALLRWNNPKYFHDSPLNYIKIAEKTNLIIKIGEVVLEKSFEAASYLHKKGYDCHISVNFSITQLMQAGFASRFLSYYKKYNVPYSMISVEVTETLLITSFDEVSDKLNQLRKYGIKIYIDDFGMGYSSLLYLNNLPIDFIKLDREFIMHLQHNKNSRVIVKSILDMANNLGISVVAEGVETQYQVNFLNKNHCQYIQGYIISKAQDETMLEEMINDKRNVIEKFSNDSEDNNTILDKKFFKMNSK